mgnify:FL=1
MKIVPVFHNLDLLASDLVRSPGLHMSDLYGSLYEALEPDRFKPDSEPNPLMLFLGTAFEQHLERVIARCGHVVTRPGEFVTPEGIAFSPDGIVENGILRVIEYKLTWQSAKDYLNLNTTQFPPKADKWLTQLKAYCYHLETQHGRLYVYFVNGVYRPMLPMLLVWDIEFSRRDLVDNWTMLQNHAKQRKML